MIHAIRLRNFKCFRTLNIALAPITLFAGLNGMGKSSVLQAILLIRQSFESNDLRYGRLLLGGPLTDIGSGADALFEEAEEDAIEIEMLVETKPLEQHIITFRFAYDRESDSLCDSDLGKLDELPLGVRDDAGVESNLLYKLYLKPSLLADVFFFVAAERLGPRKTLPLSASSARKRDLGMKGEYVLQILLEYGEHRLLSEDDPRRRVAPSLRFSDQVDAWLQDISPGSHLGDIEAIRSADAALAGFAFDRKGDVRSRRFRATNVGFGLSYVLPVIVALLLAEPGELVILENPEAHMHPRGQTCLGQLAARAAAAGVQVIAETHSDHFLDGVRIDVRHRHLEPKDTAFHYFIRSGIEASVVSPTIDVDGRLSEWPEGFFDQHGENLAILLAPKN
jgi:predicted ATPase